MESSFLLNIVILEGAAIFKLLTCENKSLLIRRNSFLILDLLLHGFNGVSIFDFQGDGLTGECFDKDLHPTTKTEDKVKSSFLLDVILLKSAAVFKMVPCKVC